MNVFSGRCVGNCSGRHRGAAVWYLRSARGLSIAEGFAQRAQAASTRGGGGGRGSAQGAQLRMCRRYVLCSSSRQMNMQVDRMLHGTDAVRKCKATSRAKTQSLVQWCESIYVAAACGVLETVAGRSPRNGGARLEITHNDFMVPWFPSTPRRAET